MQFMSTPTTVTTSSHIRQIRATEEGAGGQRSRDLHRVELLDVAQVVQDVGIVVAKEGHRARRVLRMLQGGHGMRRS